LPLFVSMCLLPRAGGATRLLRLTAAETALSVLESFPPDILVSNIKLPLRDGAWLIGQIRCHSRSELQHIPALAVTSYDREVSANSALAAGFDLFLSKLDVPEALVEAVSTLVVNPKDRDHQRRVSGPTDLKEQG
jgi:CheY-like chemotaxis protein